MKEYRNSIRSKKMIKQALIEILKTTEISKVTVKMVVDKADLSRNTFYAHYQDVYSIIDEMQKEVIESCIKYLDEVLEGKNYNETNTLQFFTNMIGFINDNSDAINVLLKTDKAGIFIDKLKNLLISRILAATKSLNIVNITGYMIFLDILFVGAIDLIKLYINGKINLSLTDLAIETNNIFQAGYKSYI